MSTIGFDGVGTIGITSGGGGGGGGSNVEQTLKLALVRGPSSVKDPDGTGLVIVSGMVTSVGGLAERWGSFKVKDEILTISGKPYSGGPIGDHFAEGKNAYLCTVRRYAPATVIGKILCNIADKWSSSHEWNSEEELLTAYEQAGDYLKGIARS